MDERRQEPRLHALNLVSFGTPAPEREGSLSGIARSIDLSVGGVGLEIADPYPLHTIFELDLGLGEEILSVRGELRYIGAEDNGLYRAGIRFQALDETRRAVLERYLEARERA